jgi:hypothetical protein
VNVYLILRKGRLRPTFLAEPVEEATVGAPEAPARVRPEDRSRLVRTVRALKAALWRAGRRSGPVGRRALAWLSRRREPDEPLLRALRSATSLDLHHPSNLTPKKARREWRHYLARRRNTHFFRAGIDLALAALSLPLMILPGPNVVGFWFLWRSGLHGLIVLGTRRALRDDPAPRLIARDELNERLEAGDPEAIGRLGVALGIEDLATLLRRLDSRRTAEVELQGEEVAGDEDER